MNEMIGVLFFPTYLSSFCSFNSGGAFAFVAFSWDSLYPSSACSRKLVASQ